MFSSLTLKLWTTSFMLSLELAFDSAKLSHVSTSLMALSLASWNAFWNLSSSSECLMR